MELGAPTAMPTDPAGAILTLAQWFSPSYPVGAFSYSHGLEAVVEAGTVSDADNLSTWLAHVLNHGAGRSDALFLAAAYHAQDHNAVVRIDADCRAFAASRERLRETDLQGAAFGKITADVFDTTFAHLCYPVAVGYAARHHDLPLDLTAQMYLHAFLSNLVAAGQRLAGIGQTEAQAIIRTLAPRCAEIAQDTHGGDLDTLSNTAFLADIAAMKHETQYARIFRT